MEGKYVKITEQNLIKQLKEKNSQAIDYIIDQYGGLIKAVLLKNLYDQKDHWEECFNDCLLAVWNNPERFDGKKGEFKAFLCAIAKYNAIDLLRSELKRTSKEISIYEEESIKEIKQLYQEECGFIKAEEDVSDEEVLLSGTNKKGDKIYFEAFFDEFTGNEYLYGTRENDNQLTYELDEKDLSYTLRTEEGQELKIKP